jgi:hypothetical protein
MCFDRVIDERDVQIELRLRLESPHGPFDLQPHIMGSDNETPDFLAFGQDLVEPRSIRVSGTSSVNFNGLLSPPLLLHEDLAEGCGGMLWPAGMVLAEYMLRHPELTEGKTMFVSCAVKLSMERH